MAVETTGATAPAASDAATSSAPAPVETPATQAPVVEAPAPQTQAPVVEAPAPQTQAPVVEEPATQAPVTQAPETTAPQTTTPPSSTPPETTTPGTTTPGTTTPGTTTPGTTTPETTTPGTTTPGTTTPETTAPGTTAPGTTAAGTTAPGTTAPGATTDPTGAGGPPPPPPGPAAPPTPVQQAEIVQEDRIPLPVVEQAPDLRDVAVQDDRIPSAVISEAPDPSGAELGDLTAVDVFSGSADIGVPDPSSADPSNADLVESFLDPAIPAAGVGVLDETGGGDPLGDLAREIVQATTDVLAAVARLWADPPSPGIGTVDGGVATPSDAATLLSGSLAWYTAAVAVVAVLIGAGRLVWQRRSQPAADVLRGLMTLVLVGGAALTGVTLLVSAADAFSVWLLQQATGDVEAGLTDLLALKGTEEMSVVLTILVGTAVLLGGVLQIVLIIARGAALVVLAGVLPLSASATNTDTGRAVFVRTLTWVVAFALYQPAAAMVYAAAFLLAPPADSPVVAALTGLTFQILAIAALPALMRLLRPVVRSATAGGGRHRATAVGLPSGARAVSPVRLADSGASGAAATVKVPSTRGGGSGSAAVALPRSGARLDLGALGVGPLGRDTVLEPVPVTGRAARRRLAEDRALPAPRIDGEDLVP